ncbi:RNA polymerase sigma factor [Flavitalea flava]
MSKEELHTSKELLQRVAKDDHDAFRQLFDLYADRLYAAVYNYTKSRFIAEELVQEVFIKLWDHRTQLKEIQDLTAYLYRMVFNHINTYLKRTANERRILEKAETWMTAGQDGTRQQLEANEMLRIINTAINRLPPQKKLIYHLSREKGLSYQEIAEKLHLSPNTVKNHLVEAMKLLRSYLKDHALEITLLILQTLMK